MSVGLVVVSHSSQLADGVVELAEQMAEGISIIAAGGTDDGRVGTSFERVETAVARADTGDGVAIFADLGSAVLTAETVVDLLDEEAASRVAIVDAPLVEGTVAAAVAAAGGADLQAVAAAGRTAWEHEGAQGEAVAGESAAPAAGAPPSEVETRSRRATIINPDGLHARPAAQLVKAAAEFDAQITIGGADAKSLLRIISLGASQGQEVEVRATGPQAAEAVAALADLVASGFGEV